MNDFLEQWQSCPQCKGDCGMFEVAETASVESSYIAWKTCDVCAGEGVISIRCPGCNGSGVDDPDHP
jgi:DnaJ-class molecular chaperone